MEKTIELMKLLKGSNAIEFNDLHSVIPRSKCIGKKNIYFCAGVKKGMTTRCNDDDIVSKNYFVVDIDIRLDYYKKYKKVLSQEEMETEIEKILKALEEAHYKDHSCIVNSGNGIHIYYCGTERAFDKEIYSAGVQYVYEGLNDAIESTGYVCDSACHNIARIMRLPGTINPRRKEIIDKKTRKKYLAFDLGDYTCDIIYFKPQISVLFENLEDFAETHFEDIEKEKEDEIKIRKIMKREYKKPSDVRKQINDIPACDVACDIRPITVGNTNKDNVPLKESKKNMGAYRYSPHNVIVNTGSSMIMTDKSYFTTYELVYYEYANKDKQATIQYFKDKHNIDFQEPKQKGIVIEKKEYKKQGYLYGSETFDKFDCIMSGELAVIVALSNTGKTTFAMDMLMTNIKRDKKCFYINLEFAIETVRQNRRLFMNGKRKRNLTDIEPLNKKEELDMNNYIKRQLKKFQSYSNPKGISLENLVELIKVKNDQGYGFFVVDTFSRIDGNMDSKTAFTSQNNIMKVLQDLCQAIGVVVVLLHHTNKKGEFEGSQKIMDLSNVFLVMSREDDPTGARITKFTLTKDKFTSYTELETTYNNGEYFLFHDEYDE